MRRAAETISRLKNMHATHDSRETPSPDSQPNHKFANSEQQDIKTFRESTIQGQKDPLTLRPKHQQPDTKLGQSDFAESLAEIDPSRAPSKGGRSCRVPEHRGTPHHVPSAAHQKHSATARQEAHAGNSGAGTAAKLGSGDIAKILAQLQDIVPATTK